MALLGYLPPAKYLYPHEIAAMMQGSRTDTGGFTVKNPFKSV